MKATGEKKPVAIYSRLDNMEFGLTLLKIKRTNRLRRIIVSLSDSIRPLRQR